MTVSGDTRVRVHVHAADPITRAGAVSQLGHHRGLELVDGLSADASGTVTVLIAETVDPQVLAALRRLSRTAGARIVLVVERMREAELLSTVECGVAAILWRREATATRLSEVVLAAARGDGDLPADLLAKLISQMGRLQRSIQGLPGFTPPGVSPREADVLRLLAEGCDTAEIASQLAYSQRTVKNVLHGMTSRLHLRNRAHAVAYALREGYI
ncbi:response regulator transcription factor [Streptomyces sp. LARHCF249]